MDSWPKAKLPLLSLPQVTMDPASQHQDSLNFYYFHLATNSCYVLFSYRL